MPTTEQKRATFRELHRAGCFVLPNPWDLGSARHLESLGFKALATTSSGFAWSRGASDNHVSLEDAIRHLADLAPGVGIPLNADFEDGFAAHPTEVAANVRRAITTGISGISIEDSDRGVGLFDFDLAVQRVRAAADAVAGTGVVLTARSEGFLVGRPDLDETIRRLEAYADAGAECLYAPGIRTREQIAAVVQAVAPKPVNVLAPGSHMTVADLAQLGVRRISVGGALARTAWTGFLAAARQIAQDGTFHALAAATPFAEINGLFEKR